MRRSRLILGWLVIAAAAAWALYDWVFISEGPAYFSADWRRIAGVAVLSIVSGLVVFGFMQCPEPVRRRLAAMIFGSGALLAIAGCGYSLWQLVRLREFLPEVRLLWLVLGGQAALCLLFGVLCVRLWLHYRKR
ncbi:hypothetical protein [Limisphaera sp. VF-2]|uniref:hypothetical protein n=1 Tax=Limisphaera sp. VF-2 TaxID=3400418 RepID=UPI0017591287